jgi:flavin-binding protein dodecin
MPEGIRTPKAVADSLEEAAQTLHRLPPVRVQGYFTTWPPIIREFWEAFGRHAAEVRLGPPTPDAIDRMDEALQWLHWLELNEVRLVWLRAEGARWKSIAYRFGMDRSTAWRHWSCALIKIAAHLNGMSATKASQQNTARQQQPNLAR